MQNVDNIRMVNISEPIFQSTETINEFDITYIDNTSFKYYKENYKDFKSSGELNLYAYHIKLMLKIGETSPLKRERFIDYQIRIHKDPLTWLLEIDDLINQNDYQFEDKPTRWESFEDFREIIKKKVKAIELNSSQTEDYQQKINYTNYQKFLALFDFNYLAHPSILFFYNELLVKREQLNQEILNNLVNLSSEEKRAYFEKMKFEINTLLRNPYDKNKEIIEFQDKYDAVDFDIYKSIFAENKLYQILSFPEDIVDIDNPTEPEKEIMDIRFAYYNLYYSDSLKTLLKFIGEQEQIYFPNKELQPLKSELFWKKYDIDLLELITALMESGSINNQTMNLTRKDAIKLFESFLNTSIKDAESKLSKGTTRKRDSNPFLNSLAKAFKDYSEKKLD